LYALEHRARGDDGKEVVVVGELENLRDRGVGKEGDGGWGGRLASSRVVALLLPLLPLLPLVPVDVRLHHHDHDRLLFSKKASLLSRARGTLIPRCVMY
jgi:hypothetical protein